MTVSQTMYDRPAHERTHAADQADTNEATIKKSVAAANTAAVQAILESLTSDHHFDDSQIKTDSESLEHWGKDWTKQRLPSSFQRLLSKYRPSCY